jgi:uncharacterized protein YprB with RNaseH-like and TPR domain
LRLTVWDLETTDLSGGFGRLLCCSFADIWSDKVETYRRDRRPWRSGRWSDNDDSKLAIAIRDRLEQADIIIGWNSILFDAPFLNARLAAAGERPLRVGATVGSSHLDLMYAARGQGIRAGGSKLESIARFFNVEHMKTALTAETWSNAAAGDRKALDEVVTHCIADVQTTRDVYPHLAPYCKKISFNFSEVYHVIHEIPSRRIRKRMSAGVTRCTR